MLAHHDIPRYYWIMNRLLHINSMLHGDNLAPVIDFIVALTGILSRI